MCPRCNHVKNTLKRDINAGRTWNKHDLFDQISLGLNIYPHSSSNIPPDNDYCLAKNKQKILLGPERGGI